MVQKRVNHMTEEGGDTQERVPIRISERHLRVAGVLVVVAMVMVLLFWGMVPETIYEVNEITSDATAYDGNEVSVKGVITGWDNSSHNFTLQDSFTEDTLIHVTHEGAFPEGFGYNATAVIKGRFDVMGSGVFHLSSQSIQIGCPSKY